MKKEEKPWSDKLVLVCRKCGDAIAGKSEKTGDENPADALRVQMKKQLQAEGRWGKIRVVGSTCLDLCPEGEVAVAVCAESSRELYAIDPKNGYSQLLEKIKK